MDEFRPLLTTYAYNITGSLEDARDIVQDAFLKFMKEDRSHIENKRAYLIRTVINLSINQKKKQQTLLTEYPGPWLPEPIASEAADSSVLKEELLSYSLMVLAEKLNPRQRAVFILKEAFDYEHEEIAEVLDISIENSRQLLSRARQTLRLAEPVKTEKVPSDYLQKYLQLIRDGDTTQLERLLAKDITAVSDGGGKAVAFRNPIIGRENVLAMLVGVYQKFYRLQDIQEGWINHEPALLYYEEGRLTNCQVFCFENGQLSHFYFIRNPDKLKNLQNSF